MDKAKILGLLKSGEINIVKCEISTPQFNEDGGYWNKVQKGTYYSRALKFWPNDLSFYFGSGHTVQFLSDEDFLKACTKIYKARK